MFFKPILLSLVTGAFALPNDLAERQSCPAIHIFGARETTAPPGYGSAGTVVNSILNSHPGSTAEAINYPASGSNPSYSDSVRAGTAAVVSQVSSFARRCPGTKLVLVGYSQVNSHSLPELLALILRVLIMVSGRRDLRHDPLRRRRSESRNLQHWLNR